MLNILKKFEERVFILIIFSIQIYFSCKHCMYLIFLKYFFLIYQYTCLLFLVDYLIPKAVFFAVRSSDQLQFQIFLLFIFKKIMLMLFLMAYQFKIIKLEPFFILWFKFSIVTKSCFIFSSFSFIEASCFFFILLSSSFCSTKAVTNFSFSFNLKRIYEF